MNVNKKIAIIGGTGFIGKLLLYELSKQNCYDIVVFSRNKNNLSTESVKFVVSDFKDLKYQGSVLKNIEVIVNLVTPRENTKEEAKNFINICNLSNIKKIIHISSISVYGSQKNKTIYEDTKLLPSNNYSLIKILFDKTILAGSSNDLKVVVLRPTIVFGTGSLNLKKTFLDFVTENHFISFLKKSFFYERRMNLLSVNNLVDCIIFMIEKKIYRDEIFIVSEDECKENNYLFLYSQFEILLRRKIILKPIKIPLKMSQLIFQIFKKESHGLNVVFSNSKLKKSGYITKYSFKKELKYFVSTELKKLLNVI